MLEHLIGIAEWAGLASLPLFILWDRLRPARRFATARGWVLRAVLVSLASLAVSIVVTLGWGKLLEGFSLFDGGRLGIAGGALVGVLVYELLAYAYHRSAHAFDPLWRWAHQLHHSAESLEALGANYLSPLDSVLFATWGSLVYFPLLGLDPAAAVLASAFVAVNAVFQHANIRTPRWLGYIVQRPESHAVHHQRGVHGYNYADLPLVDMLFGTFHNPESFDGECGFWKGASARIGDMLLGRDVSREPEAAEPASLERVA